MKKKVLRLTLWIGAPTLMLLLLAWWLFPQKQRSLTSDAARRVPMGCAKAAPIVATPSLPAPRRMAFQASTNGSARAPGVRLSGSELDAFRVQFHFTAPRERKDVPPGEQILLQSRLIVTTHATNSFAQANLPTVRGTRPMIVQFRKPVTAATRAALAARGAVVHGYLPNRAFLIEATRTVGDSLAADPDIRYLGEFLPSDKIQPFLGFLAGKTTGRVDVNVLPLSAADLPTVVAAVAASGGTLASANFAVRAEIDLAALPALAASGAIRWIEYRAPARAFSDSAHNANHLDTRPLWDTWGLTGAGQIIGHSDTGLDSGDLAWMHPDLVNVIAILPLDSRATGKDTSGHGTHTAGLIIGNGACSAKKYRGTAYGAKLVHEPFYVDSAGGLNSDLYENVFSPAYYSYGAKIHSASWGFQTAGGIYDSTCQLCDSFTWLCPDFLLVVAAGNEGTDANRDGVVDANSVSSPATAKSVLTVGAAENDRAPGSGGYSSNKWGAAWANDFPVDPIKIDYISQSADLIHQGLAGFSGRGPTADGRIKPDVVSPGTDIISTHSSYGGSGWGMVPGNSRYNFNGGTSMATPLVAGGAALMRQYAMERGGISKPSGALIKAMLIGGARSLTPGQYGTGATREIPAVSPNGAEGWGEADFTASVHPTNQMVRLVDDIRLADGATNTYAVSIARAGAELAATLVWTDYPASLSAAKTLVNDYDLELVDPSGSVVYANGLSAPDTLNTVEKVLVTNAVAGTYTFRVIARECPYGPEEGGAVALVLRGAFEAAPLIVHTPLDFFADVANPVPIGIHIQALEPLTNEASSVTVRYAAGTASAITGAWAEVPATWLSNACYRAEIPAAGANLVWHYQLFARAGASLAATSTVYTTVVGAPVRLVVSGNPAAYGITDPAYGTNTVATGSAQTLSAPEYVSGTSSVRYRCRGYVGSGDVPFYGSTNAVTFTATQDSSLTWVWLNQYALTENQKVTYYSWYAKQTALETVWCDAGTVAATRTVNPLLFFSGYGYFGFAGWEVGGVHHAENPVTGLVMTSAVTAVAAYLPFYQDATGDGLYDWWTKRFFNTTTNLDASADADGDGFSNQAECYDSTDPTDAASYPVPPVVTLHAIAAFQTNFPPWTVTADVTDNFTVVEADLFWREEGDTNWNYTVMSLVSGSLYSASFTPASFGVKRVEYCVAAYDLLGLATDYQFGTVSESAYAIGYYASPAAALTPSAAQLYCFTPSAGETNVSFTLQNLAGPDLVWTARYAVVAQVISATNAGWSASGWTQSTHRSEDGSVVWYCGDDATHTYANSAAEHLVSPAIPVPAAGGVLTFRHWILSEINSAAEKTAWDGGIFSISTDDDDGATWTKLTPPGGYPYKISKTANALLSTDEPCYAGDGSDGWQEVPISLYPYAGKTIRLRFSFGSDLYVNAEGWYIGGLTLYAGSDAFPAWFQPTGPTNGTLTARATTELSFAVRSAGLTPHVAKKGLLSLASNAAADFSPQVGLSFELGNTLTLYAQEHGTLTPSAPVFLFAPSNSPLVTATADTCYHVTGMVAYGGTNLFLNTNAETVAVQLTDLRADTLLIAAFAETYTLHSLPATWLAAYGFTNDFNSAELADSDGDGLATWQEYYTDTDPTNVDSVLKFIAITNGTLTWIGGVRVSQTLESAPAPTGTWEAVTLYSAPTAKTNTYSFLSTNAPSRFYRIRVK